MFRFVPDSSSPDSDWFPQRCCSYQSHRRGCSCHGWGDSESEPEPEPGPGVRLSSAGRSVSSLTQPDHLPGPLRAVTDTLLSQLLLPPAGALQISELPLAPLPAPLPHTAAQAALRQLAPVPREGERQGDLPPPQGP